MRFRHKLTRRVFSWPDWFYFAVPRVEVEQNGFFIYGAYVPLRDVISASVKNLSPQPLQNSVFRYGYSYLILTEKNKIRLHGQDTSLGSLFDKELVIVDTITTGFSGYQRFWRHPDKEFEYLEIDDIFDMSTSNLTRKIIPNWYVGLAVIFGLVVILGIIIVPMVWAMYLA